MRLITPILIAGLLFLCTALLAGCLALDKTGEESSDPRLELGGGGVRYKVPF